MKTAGLNLDHLRVLLDVMELGSTEAMKEIVGAGLVTRSLTPRLGRELAVVTRRDKPVSCGLRQVLDGLLGLNCRGTNSD